MRSFHTSLRLERSAVALTMVLHNSSTADRSKPTGSDRCRAIVAMASRNCKASMAIGSRNAKLVEEIGQSATLAPDIITSSPNTLASGIAIGTTITTTGGMGIVAVG